MLEAFLTKFLHPLLGMLNFLVGRDFHRNLHALPDRLFLKGRKKAVLVVKRQGLFPVLVIHGPLHQADAVVDSRLLDGASTVTPDLFIGLLPGFDVFRQSEVKRIEVFLHELPTGAHLCPFRHVFLLALGRGEAVLDFSADVQKDSRQLFGDLLLLPNLSQVKDRLGAELLFEEPYEG